MEFVLEKNSLSTRVGGNAIANRVIRKYEIKHHNEFVYYFEYVPI